MEQLITDSFFQFEIQHHLFDIKDQHGNRVWDIIRPLVFAQIFRNGQAPEFTHAGGHDTWKRRVGNLLIFVRHFLANWNKEYMFLLCSRNFDGRVYFDKIADQTIQLLPSNQLLCYESYADVQYAYRYPNSSREFVGYIRRIIHLIYDFSPIEELLKETFPSVSFDVTMWMEMYQEFYAQYYYYRFIFKVKNVKKCFILQNGFRNGLYAAASKRGVTVIELQHGEITRNHPAYSYPQEVGLADKIYKPNTILTFGKFWMSDCYYPGVQITPLGNDYYYIKRKEAPSIQKDVLVVSSKIHGELLSDLLENVLQSDVAQDIHFYFKLHPNEAQRFEYYVERFKPHSNVEVLPAANLISDYYPKVAFVLAIQSTAEFEALASGVKVIVYKRGDYKYVDSLFEEEGVFLIDNADDFLNVYERNKTKLVKDYSELFFQPFDSSALNEFMM